MYNIDYLRKNSKGYPWQHGLGFIKLHTTLGYSLNFHSDIIPSPTRNLHNHTKNFRSECLIGSIKNIIYDYKKVHMSDWCLESITCKEGDEPKVIEENVYPYIISEEIQNIGDVINHKHNEIHDFKLLTKHACTKFNYTSKYLHDAYIIRDKRNDFQCAYADTGTPKENWEIIREIIDYK